jgi:serine/threonine protein kinase
MPLSPGTRVGQYEVTAPIGAGGMGEVYRARDRRLDRDVAIKALPSTLASDPDRLSRLEREALILARLNHPNIGAIYGLEESGHASYLILELIDGETLDERLARTGPIPAEEALRLGSQIADALEAANAKGITHRDIKPSNIRVTPEGRVKVVDFGIATSLAPIEIRDDVSTRSAGTAPPLTSDGGAGTPPYMSPEQIRGQITDQRSDVWGFGCVMYELLCGMRPFRGSTVPDLMATILRGEPDWNPFPRACPQMCADCWANAWKKMSLGAGSSSAKCGWHWPVRSRLGLDTATHVEPLCSWAVFLSL